MQSFVKFISEGLKGHRPHAGRALLIGKNSGQATVEYVVASGIITAVVVIMGLLLTTFNEYGRRLFELIASDYP